MVYCPYCNRWFKNKQALRAHLKHCPLKKGTPTIKGLSNQIEERFFEFAGARWRIKGKKGFLDILWKIDKELKERGFDIYNRSLRLRGALYALKELGIVEEFEVKAIKQQKRATAHAKA